MGKPDNCGGFNYFYALMKKFIRFVLVLLAIVITLVLITAIVEPKDITVQRSIVIKAPKDSVFAQIVNFKNWTHWSPWYKLDSTMKITYTGTDGQQGSGYQWVGDEKTTGTGNMKNTVVTGTKMDYELHFVVPFEKDAVGYLKADDTAGMTKATWSITMHYSFPFNAVLAVLKMDKFLGGDFESGLTNLKTYTEARTTPTAASDVQVKEIQYAAHLYQGVRKTISWGEITKFCADTYTLEATAKATGPKVGLYYTWDTTNKHTDMAAVIPVVDTTHPIKGAGYIQVAAAKAYTATYTGGYSGGMKVHAALARQVAAKGQQQALVIEEYITGPATEKDSTKWVTNIYYLVK